MTRVEVGSAHKRPLAACGMCARQQTKNLCNYNINITTPCGFGVFYWLVFSNIEDRSSLFIIINNKKRRAYTINKKLKNKQRNDVNAFSKPCD